MPQAVWKSPRIEPLIYPGDIVGGSGIVTFGGFLPVESRGQRLGRWHTPDGPGLTLEESLQLLGQVSLRDRTPVLATGPLACADYLRHVASQFRIDCAFPLLEASVHGLTAAHAPFVAQRGYVPATLVASPESELATHVLLLDDEQLKELDLVESGFSRVELCQEDGYAVHLGDDIVLPRAYAYVANGGYLTARGAATPLPLHSQDALLALIIESSQILAAALGATAAEVCHRARCSDGTWRESTRQALDMSGMVARELELSSLGCRKGQRPWRLGDASGCLPCPWCATVAA